jgi:hypothetical protein
VLRLHQDASLPKFPFMTEAAQDLVKHEIGNDDAHLAVWQQAVQRFGCGARMVVEEVRCRCWCA